MTVAFAPEGESYWWYRPVGPGQAEPLTEEKAHLIGRRNVDCEPSRPFVVRAARQADAEAIGAEWVRCHAKVRPPFRSDTRRGELPGTLGSFYFVLRD